jgi:hypothetical protein
VVEGRVGDSRERQPVGYALSSGFLFAALASGFLHFPLWFGVMSGAAMAFVVWTGWRAGGWMRRAK